MGPWRRLPLTVRWLRQEYQLDFPLDRQPPSHMPIAYGEVELTQRKKRKQTAAEGTGGEEEVELEEVASQGTHFSCYICNQVGL